MDEAVRVIAGVGLRRACPASELVALVRRAAEQAGCEPAAIAAPLFKSAEVGLREAAASLGLDLVFIADDELRATQARCPTRSESAERAVGVASVAEGAALAAAGAGGSLLLPRITSPSATCALAAAP